MMNEDDEALANSLFGFVEIQKSGLRVTRYHKKGSKEEQSARKAIAQLLRSGRPLTQHFRDGLADYLDPPRGRPRDHVMRTQIAEYVFECKRAGDEIEVAQRKAADRFGKSFETVRDIWGKGNGRLKGLGSLLQEIEAVPLKVEK